MTGRGRPVCDFPNPAPAMSRAMFKARTRPTSRCWPAWKRPPRAGNCTCRLCQVKTSCGGVLFHMMVSRSPELFDRVEAWVLDGHGN